MSGAISGAGSMFCFARTTIVWSTSCFLGLPKYHPSCICYVPCYWQLPVIVSHSLPNIFQESLNKFNCWHSFPLSLAGFSPFGSRSLSPSHPYSTTAVGAPHLSTLEAQCYSFLAQGLAASTRKSYATAQSQFISFCRFNDCFFPWRVVSIIYNNDCWIFFQQSEWSFENWSLEDTFSSPKDIHLMCNSRINIHTSLMEGIFLRHPAPLEIPIELHTCTFL